MITSGYHEVTTQLCALKSSADNQVITGATVDMLGYGGVKFVIAVEEGEVGGFTAKTQQDSAANMATAADLLGTGLAIVSAVATKTVAVMDIKQPQERYVRCVLTVPNLSAPLGVAIIAEKYNPTIVPVTAPTIGEYHVSPIEGAA